MAAPGFPKKELQLQVGESSSHQSQRQIPDACVSPTSRLYNRQVGNTAGRTFSELEAEGEKKKECLSAWKVGLKGAGARN